MLINVFSWADAHAKVVTDPKFKSNWLSIRDIGYEDLYADLDYECENILVLRFDDVTRFDAERGLLHPFYKEVRKERELVFFNADMADQIISFTKSIKEGPLNIHCWAGVSRSQAIGFCLNTYFNLYLKQNQTDYTTNLMNSIRTFKGNPDVIRILTRRLHEGEI